jgi:tyrosine-protein phosphatase YwqE
LLRLFKNTPTPSGYQALQLDMHAHILPGIDDGAPDLPTAVAMIRAMMTLGFSSFIATPHIYRELYPNTRETITNALQQLKAALREAGVSVHVEAAAEYMIDDQFDTTLREGNLLTLPGNRVLVEMPTLSAPPTLNEHLFQLQLAGYNPIIAHPERYLFVGKNKNRYHDWVDKGFDLQLNLLSLTGYYGPSVRENAIYLVKNKLLHFAGTDAHHLAHLQLLQKGLKNTDLARFLAAYPLNNSTLAPQ